MLIDDGKLKLASHLVVTCHAGARLVQRDVIVSRQFDDKVRVIG